MNTPRDIPKPMTVKQYAEKIRDDLQNINELEDPNNIIIDTFGLNLSALQRKAIEEAVGKVFKRIAKFEKKDQLTVIKSMNDEKIFFANEKALMKWGVWTNINSIHRIVASNVSDPSALPVTQSAVMHYIDYLVHCRMEGQPEVLDTLNPAVLREFIFLEMLKKDQYGSRTWLHWVTNNCSEQVIEALLAKLLEVQNKQQREEKKEGKKPDQQLLLDKIIGLPDSNGNTIFHCICIKNNQSATLINKLAQLTSHKVFNQELIEQNGFGNTPLHLCVTKEVFSASRAIIKEADSKAIGDAFVKQDNNYGFNALHVAALKQDSDTFQTLITVAGSAAVSEALIAEPGITVRQRVMLAGVGHNIVFVLNEHSGLDFTLGFQNFAAIMRFKDIASPFALALKWGEHRWLPTHKMSFKVIIENVNDKLTPDGKEKIIKLFDEYCSFVNRPEDNIKNNLQKDKFITFIKHYLKQEKWYDADKWIALLEKAYRASPVKATQDTLATLLAGRCLSHYYQVKKHKKTWIVKDKNEKYINTFYKYFPINSINYAYHCTPQANLVIANFFDGARLGKIQLPASLASLSEKQLEARFWAHCHEAAIYKHQQAINLLNLRIDPVAIKINMLKKIGSDLKIDDEKIIEEISDRLYQQKERAEEEYTFQSETNYYAALQEMSKTLSDELKAAPPQKAALLKKDIQDLDQLIKAHNETTEMANNLGALKEELKRIFSPLNYLIKKPHQRSNLDNVMNEGINTLRNVVLNYQSGDQNSGNVILIMAIEKIIEEVMQNLNTAAKTNQVFDEKRDEKSQDQKKFYEGYQIALQSAQKKLITLRDKIEKILEFKADEADSKIVASDSILGIQYCTACLVEVQTNKPSSSLPTIFSHTKDDRMLSSVVKDLKQFADNPSPDTIKTMILQVTETLQHLKGSTPEATTSDIRVRLLEKINSFLRDMLELKKQFKPESFPLKPSPLG